MVTMCRATTGLLETSLVVRRGKTIPRHKLLNKLLRSSGSLSVPERRMPWSGASSRGGRDGARRGRAGNICSRGCRHRRCRS